MTKKISDLRGYELVQYGRDQKAAAKAAEKSEIQRLTARNQELEDEIARLRKAAYGFKAAT